MDIGNFKPLSIEEYSVICNEMGITDKLDIELAYKIHVADITGTMEDLMRPYNNYYYNHEFKLAGRLN